MLGLILINHFFGFNGRLDVNGQVVVLVDTVKQCLHSHTMGSEHSISRTSVFANTVDAAESVAKTLQRVGVNCICYHSGSSLEERAEPLTGFQEKGEILMCTDAAANGLDIPDVAHVIQAELATSAVDFLFCTELAVQQELVNLDLSQAYTESPTVILYLLCVKQENGNSAGTLANHKIRESSDWLNVEEDIDMVQH